MEYSIYQTTVSNSMQMLYEKVIVFLPNILAALVVVILGWLLAIFLSKLVLKVLEAIKIDSLANSVGLAQLSEKSGRNLSISRLGAWVVKWFFFLASFIAAAEILGLSDVTRFFYDDVISYAGRVVVAMAVLLLGILAANFFGGLVDTTVKASGIFSPRYLGTLTRWVIMIFAVVTALTEILPSSSQFLQNLFTGIVAMLAIAGGIAFGLGGREHAKKILDNLESGLQKRN